MHILPLFQDLTIDPVVFSVSQVVLIQKELTMAKSVKTSSGFTKEEQLLLNDFSRNVSTKSSALFYGNAMIVSAIPICKSGNIMFSELE